MKTIEKVLLATCIVGATSLSYSQNMDNSYKSNKNPVMTEPNNKMNTTKSDKMNPDSKFVTKAAESGLMEVKVSEFAQNKAISSQVKELAKTMVEDHGKINTELKSLARRKGISIASKVTDKDNKKYTDLSEKNGDDFDKAYVDMMTKDHKDAVDEFQKEADKGEDADIKTWANEKLPMLKHHLSMAESTKDVVRK